MRKWLGLFVGIVVTVGLLFHFRGGWDEVRQRALGDENENEAPRLEQGIHEPGQPVQGKSSQAGQSSEIQLASDEGGGEGRVEVAFSEELLMLGDLLTGSFSSAEQASSDSSYYPIALEMVRIASERRDGLWLYVEQALASRLGTAPYRQRIYRLHEPRPGIFHSDVYTLPGDPLRFAGAYEDSSLLEAIPLDSLTLREGCTIVLKKMSGRKFQGATDGKGCGSDLHGAAYATSVVSITPEQMVSWDRGFDEQGQQVWGAENGGYVFDKQQNHPLK